MNRLDSEALDRHITGNYGEDRFVSSGDVLDEQSYEALLNFVELVRGADHLDFITSLARWSAANGGNSDGCDACGVNSDAEVFEAAGLVGSRHEHEPSGDIAISYCGKCVAEHVS